MSDSNTGWQNTPPPPVAPPAKGNSPVLAVVIIVIGGVIVLLGIMRVVGAETPYLAGRAMGQVTLGAAGVIGGCLLLAKALKKA